MQITHTTRPWSRNKVIWLLLEQLERHHDDVRQRGGWSIAQDDPKKRYPHTLGYPAVAHRQGSNRSKSRMPIGRSFNFLGSSSAHTPNPPTRKQILHYGLQLFQIPLCVRWALANTPTQYLPQQTISTMLHFLFLPTASRFFTPPFSPLFPPRMMASMADDFIQRT
jgi:hypothetical protein